MKRKHAILFPNRRWNDLSGGIDGIVLSGAVSPDSAGPFGPSSAESFRTTRRFDFYFEGDHRLWRFMVLYGILTGCYWIVVVLSNIVFLFLPFAANNKYGSLTGRPFAFMQSLNPSYRRLIQLECLAVILLHTVIILTLKVPLLNYAVMYSALVLPGRPCNTSTTMGPNVTSHAVREICASGGQLIDSGLNHNWHRAHHEHPTVPWVHLPRLAAGQLPERGFLLWSYLKMWRGPRKANDHVENRYAGQIIR